MNNKITERRAGLTDKQKALLAQRLAGKKKSTNSRAINKRDAHVDIPLSYAQRSLWLTWQLDQSSNAYNMSGILKISGMLNKAIIKKSLHALLTRHEVLRTYFIANEQGEPKQQIQEAFDLPWAEYDLTISENTDDKTKAQISNFTEKPFFLHKEIPFRALLLSLPNNEYQLALSVHHIVADGWSLAIVLNELMAIYSAELSENAVNLAELPIQFADFAIWQRQWLEAGELDTQLSYWQEQLMNTPTILSLPYDRARKSNTKKPNAAYTFSVNETLTQQIKQLAQQQQTSLYMTVLALFKVTLFRLSGQQDICVGSPIVNRSRSETHGLIGYLTNVQVLRTQLDVTDDFIQLLNQVRTCVLAGQKSQDVPFDLLVDAIKPERQSGVHPLFQVKCTQQNALPNSYHFSGLEMELEPQLVTQAHFDLSFDFTDNGNDISGIFNYDADLFDHTSIDKFAAIFLSLTTQVTASADTPLALLALPDFESKASGTKTLFTQETVLSLWDESVAQQGPRIAVQDVHAELSFHVLDKRANALAFALQTQGVSRGDCVAIVAERSCEFVLAILAVLKAGGVYLPLDVTQPAERLAYQISDSKAAVVLTATSGDANGVCESLTDPFTELFKDQFTDLPHIALNVTERFEEAVNFTPLAIHPEQGAYIIYTSGTTGQPKGVVVTHRALNNYTQGVLAELALPETVNSMAMVSTVAADLGNTTLFGALCSGRTLHMITADIAFDSDLFADYMATHHIDVLKIVPSHLQGLLSAAEPKNVLPHYQLIVGGEGISQTLLAQIHQLSPSLNVINHYGPTESTVGVFTKPLISQRDTANAEVVDAISLGLPLANTTAYILGADLQTVPVGVVGELYIGGEGLAQGYVGQVTQTAERFIANPYETGTRLYRTGDAVKQLRDGTFEFIGRVDEQVKIRGYRVELNEVKQYLLNLENVIDAAIIVKEQDGRNQLQGYLVVADNAPLNIQAVRETLLTQVPDYMVPTSLMQLTSLPLNTNGKLDKKALYKLESSQSDSHLANSNAKETAKNDEEQLLADIWQELLKVEQVYRHDNFFELGGDSILALKVVARARKQGLKFKPKTLMENPSIAALSVTLSAPKGETETTLATIWRELLKRDTISRHDNFFELGGDSILALKVVARARKQGVKCKPKQVLESKSLMALAEALSEGNTQQYVNDEGDASLLGVPSKDTSPVVLMNEYNDKYQPLFCIHGGMGTTPIYQDVANQFDGIRSVYGIACRTIHDTSHVDTSLEQMAIDYCDMIKKVQPKGPYHLLGWSLGAPLAAMISAILEAEQHTISFLGLVDSFEPNKRHLDVNHWKKSFVNDLSSLGFDVDKTEILEQLTNKNALTIEQVKAILIECKIIERLKKSAEPFSSEFTSEHQAYIAIFMATYNLRYISHKPIHLPVLTTQPTFWWTNTRKNEDKLSVINQLSSIAVESNNIAVNHYEIIKNKDFLSELMTQLTKTERSEELSLIS